jgi:hypothetical protein
MSLEARYKEQELKKVPTHVSWRPGSDKLGRVLVELLILGGKARVGELKAACKSKMSGETYNRSIRELERQRIIKRKCVSRKNVELVVNYQNKEYPGIRRAQIYVESTRDSFQEGREDMALNVFADPRTNSLRKFLRLAKSKRKEVVPKLTELVLEESMRLIANFLPLPTEFVEVPEELIRVVVDEEILKITHMVYDWIRELAQFEDEVTRTAYNRWGRTHEPQQELGLRELRGQVSRLSGIEWAYVCVNCGTQWATDSDRGTPKMDAPKICQKCGEDPYPARNLGRSGILLKAPDRRLVLTKTEIASEWKNSEMNGKAT